MDVCVGVCLGGGGMKGMRRKLGHNLFVCDGQSTG